MTTKYNTKHPERGRSHYRERLARRGYSRTPIMEDLNSLRKRQAGTKGDITNPSGTVRRSDSFYFEDSRPG